jgi:hypothetical protein
VLLLAGIGWDLNWNLATPEPRGSGIIASTGREDDKTGIESAVRQIDDSCAGASPELKCAAEGYK